MLLLQQNPTLRGFFPGAALSQIYFHLYTCTCKDDNLRAIHNVHVMYMFMHMHMYMYTHVHCVYYKHDSKSCCVFYLFAYMDNKINTRPGNTLTADKSGGRHATLQS